MTTPSARIPLRKPSQRPGGLIAAIYLVMLVVLLVFATLWVKVLVVYVGLLFFSVVIVNAYVQLVGKGLFVNSVTRYTVRFDEMTAVEVLPTAVPSPDYSSLRIQLVKPKRILLSYVLPIPIRLSEVRVDVLSPDADALRRTLADRLNLR